MPTYQYTCTDAECGHRFELVQSFTDPAASECPVCGHVVRKVYGAVGVVFKGSGFYRTDSRSGGSSERRSEGGSGSTPEKSGASTSGTSKDAPSSSGSSSSSGPSSSSSPAPSRSSSSASSSPAAAPA
ncbi:MAG: FmdB family transcriptional regulator [Actinobacteria bacterium]|nr:FmdB family transcriptional regulator [Actinomycetota bacterium]